MSASSTTSMPTSSATLPASYISPGVPKPKFNDTFAYVVLAVVGLLAILLLAMLGYLIYLCCRGQCPKCRDMKQQLDKWEFELIKRITKDMASKREVYNKHKSTTSSYVSSDTDIELGVYSSRTSARTEALNMLEGQPKPSFWQNAKSKMTGKGKSCANTRSPSPSSPTPTNIDRFFTVDIPDEGAAGPFGTYYIPPQPPQVSYEPSPTLRPTSYASSEYSQPTGSTRTCRVFTDHTGSSFKTRGPLQKEADGPKSYTAYSCRRDSSPEIYNPRPKQLRIRLAEEAFDTQEYKDAERMLARGSAVSEDMRRALSIVNFADQNVNMARHPSSYTDLDAGGAERPVPDFRHDCQ
jgi:hypothetical protein